MTTDEAENNRPFARPLCAPYVLELLKPEPGLILPLYLFREMMVVGVKRKIFFFLNLKSESVPQGTMNAKTMCECSLKPHPYSSVAFDRAQRKPMVASRCCGKAPPRVAVRSIRGVLFHDPPRTDLYRPIVGPGGLRVGMMG